MTKEKLLTGTMVSIAINCRYGGQDGPVADFAYVTGTMPREIASPVFQGLSNLFDWLHDNGFKPTDSTVNARYVATRDVEFEVADAEMADNRPIVMDEEDAAKAAPVESAIEPGLYVALLNKCESIDEVSPDAYGESGPVIGPFEYATRVAGNELAFSHFGYPIPWNPEEALGPDVGLVFYVGVLYGDFEVQTPESITGVGKKCIEPYDETKAFIPEGELRDYANAIREAANSCTPAGRLEELARDNRTLVSNRARVALLTARGRANGWIN